MPWWEAVNYFPKQRTYAVRIFSSEKQEIPDLKKSENYVYIGKYFFDDNDNSPFLIKAGPKWLDDFTAERMLLDFEKHRRETEHLLVHCNVGRNRSPGTAIAFNEIFQLGRNSQELREKYPEANNYVYNKLKEAALKLAITR